MDLKAIVEKSIEFRYHQILDHENKALRLLAGVSDGLEGVLIEQYGDFVLATVYNYELAKYKKELLTALDTLLPGKSILLKIRAKMNSNDFEYLSNGNYSKDRIHFCYEDDVKYEIHTDPRHDYGLYLDTKSARAYVRGRAHDKKVLNLFSYTCAFGVAAMKGGAEFVTNIDPSKDYLNWGRRNGDNNSVLFKCYPDTTQDYLARHLRRMEKGTDSPYDFTIVDPPAFLVGRGPKRLARNMWPEWMNCLNEAKCPEFLIVINDKSFGREHDLYEFFRDGLGQDILIQSVDQSFDVIGQQLTLSDDQCYFNPLLFHITR